ncbi:hypothetical protein D3C72_2266000 [compost metagenome]
MRNWSASCCERNWNSSVRRSAKWHRQVWSKSWLKQLPKQSCCVPANAKHRRRSWSRRGQLPSESVTRCGLNWSSIRRSSSRNKRKPSVCVLILKSS